MAIYRSDQAVVTFGTEAAPGGYPELAYATETDPDGGPEAVPHLLQHRDGAEIHADDAGRLHGQGGTSQFRKDHLHS